MGKDNTKKALETITPRDDLVRALDKIAGLEAELERIKKDSSHYFATMTNQKYEIAELKAKYEELEKYCSALSETRAKEIDGYIAEIADLKKAVASEGLGVDEDKK